MYGMHYFLNTITSCVLSGSLDFAPYEIQRLYIQKLGCLCQHVFYPNIWGFIMRKRSTRHGVNATKDQYCTEDPF